MPLQAAYRLTAEDFKKAQVQHKGLPGRFLQLVGVIVILCALPSLLAHQYIQGIVGVVVGSFLAFGTGLVASRTFKKETSLQLETKVVVSEEGLMFTNPRGESRLNWGAFLRYIETEDIFVLYVQSRMFYILPKRSFPTEDILTIREMFNRHITGPSSRGRLSGMRAFLFAFVIAAAIVLVYFAMHASRR